ncbi:MULTISPECIES: DHA2 family efflux MFS transporter permease subunit [unclassified Enterococcus]|uniref:DHA2 family efflux MFS transporter permease subunit n=1 Tax=unclassified Enterococcus TaxID=2608891 RepID=UPI0015538036|nr:MULTISPECIES: DHA2 family efflux MFS transporter permease subunit [unclassified Enterococcus]MBS7576130.1 DHA2 family efflux MFS transporter permease subunit [Enterococcus sp. MMGLQ5-2]MBS7583363.1 DHA2 family efflux MFS transporter permease subunit [Enterococcus sp. MMGLQ5-1]NPD11223.1 DHA2 family efflux MFS transporter permease subunit [Enterococcus sp. MMGLQ5-1]NPD35966.1 DHA2 family efflux MFS transporter permease subunit [Enterococcus sp. MMGLQ5-2]
MNKTISNNSRTFLMIILLIMSFTATLNQTLMVTALPLMMNTLNVNLNTVQWLTTGYVLTLGIITPISALLFEKIGNRALFLSSTFLFLIGTIIGSVSNTFSLVLVARIIQAASGGIIVTFTQILLLKLFPVSKRGIVIGYINLVISAAPAIGPTLSGFILNKFNWHTLFSMTLPVTILIIILGFFFLPNYSEVKDIKIDILSITSSILGFGLLLSSFSFFLTNPLLALILLIIGLIISTYFVMRQLNPNISPLLNIRLLNNRSFRNMTISIMIIFGILMGTETILPLFTENVLGLSALDTGLLMLPGAAIMSLLSPFIGKMYDKYGMKWISVLGIILVIASCFPMMDMSKGTSVTSIIIVFTFRMLGLGLLMTVMTSEAFKQVSQNQVNHATALNNTLRQVGASFFNTLMIGISSVPINFVDGVRWAFGGTLLLTLIIAGILLNYFQKKVNHTN